MKGVLERYSHDITIALEAIIANRMRSFLTALGIIFGVAAVISMLAIGNGAQQEIIEQIKLVGVNNIIIKPIENETESTGTEVSGKKKSFSPGLSLSDLDAIKEVVPGLSRTSPVISLNLKASEQGRIMQVKLEGVETDYFEMFNLPIVKGSVFTNTDNEAKAPVCVIGDNVRATFFNDRDPINQYIKCGDIWLKVAGVIAKRDFTTSANDEMGISSSDNKIFVASKTFLTRFLNVNGIDFNSMRRAMLQGGDNSNNKTYNELEKVVVQVSKTEKLSETSELIRRIIIRKHNNNLDFEVTVPELLLKQQQQTNRIFNIVLGAIAGISLVVGGIGIMNIMLASVLERIREIGTRQALGATRKDIVIQFLAESTLISFIGGIIGIILGVFLAKIISGLADIKTIVTPYSIIISFGVSASVGIVFGLFPARRASMQDPVESLRH